MNLTGASQYPVDDLSSAQEFASLVEAATAAADVHHRDLGKRKRGQENAYIPVSSDVNAFEQPRTPTLSNSAAVLFREPSEKSKKYSRPPLGKVFTSLELAPEQFLKLQNAAKDYMLNEEHPERKDVVGHKKHNNNNDTAKLRLYQCVEDFLQQDENGENFFGHSSQTGEPDALPRTLFWPEDRSRIIKLLMPLLRKMVTNERQRVYAAETRKTDRKKPDGKTQTRDSSVTQDENVNDENLVSYGWATGLHQQPLTVVQAPEIDPSLQASGVDAEEHIPIAADGQEMATEAIHHGMATIRASVIARENGISKRLAPEIVIAAENAGTLEQFVNGLTKGIEALNGLESFEIKALLPSGLTPLRNEDDWIVSQMTVLSEVWMNGQLQLVIEV